MKIERHYNVVTNTELVCMSLYKDSDPAELKTFLRKMSIHSPNGTAYKLTLEIHKGFSQNPFCEKICNQLIDYWLAFTPQRAKDFYALCKEKGFIP